MLNSIKTLKRFCRATLNMYFKKKNYDGKKLYVHDKFFVLNQNFTDLLVKIVKNSRFFQFFFFLKFQVFFMFFQVKWQLCKQSVTTPFQLKNVFDNKKSFSKGYTIVAKKHFICFCLIFSYLKIFIVTKPPPYMVKQ